MWMIAAGELQYTGISLVKQGMHIIARQMTSWQMQGGIVAFASAESVNLSLR